MVGDSPQSLMVNLSAADAASYLADRGTNGFNTVLVDAICTTYTYGPANASLLNGTLPFTKTVSGGSYDLTAPNEAYFAYLDQVINLAATNGIEVMLDPIETGGWLPTMLANGTNSCRAYGQYLGNRYKNFPNIIWCSGNDFQVWSTAANDAVVLAVAQGLKDMDTNHLQTIELGYSLSSSLDDANWAPLVGLNAAYTYSPTYAEVLHAYNQSGAMPTFMVEANYEFGWNTDTDGGSTRNLRMQEYWTMLSGASGQLYGNENTVGFTSGWQGQLDTPGVVQLGYLRNLFGSRAWYNLVPDQTSHLRDGWIRCFHERHFRKWCFRKRQPKWSGWCGHQRSVYGQQLCDGGGDGGRVAGNGVSAARRDDQCCHEQTPERDHGPVV